MPRLDRLSELQRKSSLAHPCLLNDSAPFTHLRQPLSESRLALVTTGGIHLRGDAPYTGGDRPFRVIPTDAPPSEIVQSHASIGFDRAAFQRDINVVFPMDRVCEFVVRGEIGSGLPSQDAPAVLRAVGIRSRRTHDGGRHAR